MINKIGYKHFGKFLLRVPTYNFDIRDFDIDEKKIIKFFKENDKFREAIYIASRNLYYEIIKGIEQNNIKERGIYSLIKYFIRSRTRSTPFGMFSSVCMGAVQNDTNILLAKDSSFEKNVRVDMEIVSIITDALLSVDSIIFDLKFYPNNTIYPIGDFFSYIESEIEKDKKNYFKSTFEKTPYILSVLNFCEKGKKIEEVTEYMSKKYSIDSSEVKEFVLELIHNKILFSELEISTTDINPFKTLIKRIDEIQISEEHIIHFIEKGKNIIQLFSENKDVNMIANMDIFKNIFIPFSVDSDDLFQVDLKSRYVYNSISIKITQQVNNAINVLNYFCNENNPIMEKFKQSFYEKYQEQEVPLLKALDDDFGLGYPVQTKELLSDLLDDIDIWTKEEKHKYQIFSRKDIFLLRKLSAFFLNGELSEITISDEDLLFFDKEEFNKKKYPTTISVLVELYKNKSGKDITYVNMASASASNLLGRFSSFDPEVSSFMNEIYEKEKSMLDEDTITAEIVHLPKYREGNVLLRESHSDYEIPIISHSKLMSSRIIDLKDLYLSLKNGQLILKSKKMNKKVIPKLSSAHNYMNPQNLSLYKFLCDLQYQDVKRNIYFDWGTVGNDFIFLPRVVYKNIILSKAIWNLTSDDMKNLYTYESDEDLRMKINKWRERLKIPRLFVLKNFDNKLFIDSNNVLIFKLFLSSVKKEKKFILEEFLYDRMLLVKDEDGNYFTNELLLSFFRSDDK